jgi:hypothetical protein
MAVGVPEGESMPELEWGEDFQLVEVIVASGPVERLVCLIGLYAPATKWVRLEAYRNDELVNTEDFGFDAALPMADLIRDLEQGLRRDAQAMGGRLEIFEVPPPFGKEQFEQMLATLRPGAEN